MTPPSADAADTEPVDSLLPGDSRWTRIEHLEEVTSTNEVAADNGRSGEPPGLVVVADHQTAGRGRHGRRWDDEPGRSLLMSALVRDGFPRPSLVPLAAGLAVADAIAAVHAIPELRWPNDVLVDGRKCAGVLVEAVGDLPGRIVIGIGVNVDWRAVERDEETAAWGSLAEALDREVGRWTVLGHVLTSLDGHLRAAEGDPDRLVAGYRRRCATLGAEVEISTGAGVVVGAAEDVTSAGALVVRTGEDSVTLRAGDVVHVRRGA